MAIVNVFPARAGVSRLFSTTRRMLLGVPRASGGEPRAGRWHGVLFVCSPRERG